MNDDIITRQAPRWAWETIDTTLMLNAASSVVDPARREQIARAAEAMTGAPTGDTLDDYFRSHFGIGDPMPDPPHAVPDLQRAGLTELGVPSNLHDGLLRYVLQHIPTGSFLRAVLENDLREAVARADPFTIRGLDAVVRWLNVYAPEESWGSPAKVAAWIAAGRRRVDHAP